MQRSIYFAVSQDKPHMYVPLLTKPATCQSRVAWLSLISPALTRGHGFQIIKLLGSLQTNIFMDHGTHACLPLLIVADMYIIEDQLFLLFNQ